MAPDQIFELKRRPCVYYGSNCIHLLTSNVEQRNLVPVVSQSALDTSGVMLKAHRCLR
jgi:hypothetical protein